MEWITMSHGWPIVGRIINDEVAGFFLNDNEFLEVFFQYLNAHFGYNRLEIILVLQIKYSFLEMFVQRECHMYRFT